MFPENRLSTIPHPEEWMTAHPTTYSPYIDYEMGGIALGNSSLGLDVVLWKLAYDRINGELRLGKADEQGEVLLTEMGLKKVSLAFDVNMKPVYVIERKTGVNLNYYDTEQQQQVDKFFDGIRSPYVCLDERREENLTNADVCFCYIKGTKLYVRYQRERYLTEHLLAELTHETSYIERVGMMRNWRIGISVPYLQMVEDNE